MHDPDFFLVSSEGHRVGDPRSCKRLRRMSSAYRDDLLLVVIDPPIIGQSFGLGAHDIDTLLLATRFQGESLFPIREWPVRVHVVRLLVESPGNETLDRSEFESIAWGTLYATEDEARANVNAEH